MTVSPRYRFPSCAEMLPVFSVLVFLSFSWALYRFFWYLPSWLEYLSIGGVLVIAAYTLGFALVDASFAFGLVLAYGLLLPWKVFRERFVAQGSALALALGAGAVLVQRQGRLIYRWEAWQVFAYAGAALAGLLAVALLSGWVCRRLPFVQRLAESFAERMTVFAYLYLPLGALGLLVAIGRNIL